MNTRLAPAVFDYVRTYVIINSTLTRVEFYSKTKISTNSYEKSGDNAKILSYTCTQEVRYGRTENWKTD